MADSSSRKTILVVDDDVATQNLLKALLNYHGFESVTAGSGNDAITLLDSNDYAAIILDLMMPAVDGHGVIDYLVRENRTVPVIVCTAAGTRRVEDVTAPIVRAVIRKPFDIEQLAAAVKAVTGSAGAKG
jgi:DNA-binding response OmpR family regulator